MVLEQVCAGTAAQVSLQHAHTWRLKAVRLARGACTVKRADLFRKMALGTAGMVAARAVPTTPDEVADKMIAKGAVAPTAVNGNLHLHGDGHVITNCTFRVDGAGPALQVNGKNDV